MVVAAAVAVEAGTGITITSHEQAVSELRKVLGPLMIQAPTKPFDAEELARRLAGLEKDAKGLLEAFEWVREDRF
jgi:hypothetical protein